MLLAILLSRILGLVREVIIASQFGQSGAVSAYTAAFNLPDLLYFFLSSGALSSAFIPVFTEYLQNGREKEAWQIFSIIGSFMGILLTVIILFAWIYARPLVTCLAVPGFSAKHPELVGLTVALTRIVLPCQLFFFMGGLMMGTLEARQNFDARSMCPIIYNLGIILGALLLGRFLGVKGLAAGTLLGAFAGNIVYTFISLKKAGFEYHFSLRLNHPGVVRVAILAIPVIFGLSLPQIDVIINKWFASWVSDVAPAALNYANRLMQVPIGIFAQAAGTAILPSLSTYAAKKEWDNLRSGIGHGLSTILIENIPMTVFMIIMADPIVRTVYMWRSFTAADVPITAFCLMLYSIGIFAWSGQAIVSRGFFAIQDTLSPVVIGTVTTIIFIPLNFIFIKLLGCGGLALATTTGIIIHFIILTLWLRKKTGGIDGGRILYTVKRILAATCVLAVLCAGIRYAGYALLGTWKLVDGDIRRPEKLAVFLSRTKELRYREIKAYVSSDVRLEARKYTLYEASKKQVDRGVCDCINSLMKRDGFDKGGVYDNRRYADTAFSDCLKEFRPARSVLAGLIIGKEASARAVSSPDGLYAPSDIISTERLLREITEGRSDAAKVVKSSMSVTLRSDAERFLQLSEEVESLPSDMMECLNKYITATGKAGPKQQRLSRKKLCDTLPSYVKRRPFLRIEGNVTSGITLLAGMLACFVAYIRIMRRLGIREIDEIIQTVTGMLRRKKSAAAKES
ncbi:MAG: murein biosynthesis integral membrane protein MurJ [Abditibacteriota bacterium]|nr:murein biosynthesis integral membrane protein MurJ [Abditibacteriota bacterium]